MTHLWHMITPKPWIILDCERFTFRRMAESRSTGPPGGVGGGGGGWGVWRPIRSRKTKKQTCFFPLGRGVEAGFRGEAEILWLVGGPHTFSVAMVTALPHCEIRAPSQGPAPDWMVVRLRDARWRTAAAYTGGHASHGVLGNRKYSVVRGICVPVQPPLALCSWSPGGPQGFSSLWLKRNFNHFFKIYLSALLKIQFDGFLNR